MRTFIIIDEDGDGHCYVVANEKDEALSLQAVKTYFGNASAKDGLDCRQVPGNRTIVLSTPYGEIKHTAEEWAGIYDICAPVAFCFSED